MIDQRMAPPGCNRGYRHSTVFDTFMMLLHEGGQCLCDVRRLKQIFAISALRLSNLSCVVTPTGTATTIPLDSSGPKICFLPFPDYACLETEFTIIPQTVFSGRLGRGTILWCPNFSQITIPNTVSYGSGDIRRVPDPDSPPTLKFYVDSHRFNCANSSSYSLLSCNRNNS